MKLTILSFNIRCANDPEGHSIPERAPRVAEILKTQHPDIIGLQEYHRRWDASWPVLEDPRYEAWKIDRGDGEGLVLMWKKDRFRLLQKGFFWFGDDPRKPTTDRDEKYHKPRICGWLLLQEAKTGKEFLYMNVHYGFGDEGQVENARQILSHAVSMGSYPVIVAGDFNLQPGTPGYQAMAENFTDANKATADLQINTYHGYDKHPARLLDYCFVNDAVKAKDYCVLTQTFEGKYPSDHYPIAIELEM